MEVISTVRKLINSVIKRNDDKFEIKISKATKHTNDAFSEGDKNKKINSIFDLLKDRYNILSLFFIIFGALILINTLMLQFNASNVSGIEKASVGVSRERTITAPRGNIYDRYGIPLAISKSINVLYLCEAGLDNDKLNAMLLDLALTLEKNKINYVDNLGEYISINPLKFNKEAWEIIAWQTNRNTFNLKQSTSKGTEDYADKKYAKTDPAKFFDYLRYSLFSIDKKYSIEDSFRILRLRYEIYLDFWAYKNGKPVEIARDVNSDVLSVLEEQNYRFTGILSGQEYERRYTDDAKYISHTIGYMGAISSKQFDEMQSAGYTMDDYIGKSGIELSAERYLKGIDGVRPYNILTSFQDDETFFSEDTGRAPVAGNDIRLTIDLELQKVAINSLKENIEFIKKNAGNKNKGDADSGAVVMLDVKSGEALVLASYPGFDPQDFAMAEYDIESKKRMITSLTSTKDKPMLNRTIMEIYAPGSTFKSITSVAAIEEGVDTNQRCNGTETIAQWPFKCLEYPRSGHGNLDLTRGMATSCNIYFHKLGVATGIDKIDKWMKLFGLGEYSGIDLPGEEKGFRSNRETKKLLRKNPADQIWFPADTAQSAIGQFDNKFTILQLARYCSGLSNGLLTPPHVIKEITRSDGTILKHGDYTPTAIPVKQSTLDRVREAMIAVSKDREGTARKVFANYSITIASKTGTAETGNEDKSSSNALFICYAPADNPEVAIAQIVEKGVWGSNTMGITKNLLNAYFGLGKTIDFETITVPIVK